ncbi:c-type cytochrome [Pantoea sp. 18069]|uniref:c-type cytochrome n=1 Tax=Pantoea sp. 18069 TaxID=2681415 RepID=UPI001359D672|nr:c-type cytochrome [Pantoea sp. 18069]
MVQPSSPASRRWRRVGLGVAVAMVPALFAWLAWQSIHSRRPPPPAPAVSAAPLPAASEGWAQVQAQFCLRCHGMEQTHVGPGFAQIAQRYRGEPDALAYLARRIREGSAGVWGRKLMPRQPGISAEQAQAMAVWLLAQPDPPAH